MESGLEERKLDEVTKSLMADEMREGGRRRKTVSVIIVVVRENNEDDKVWKNRFLPRQTHLCGKWILISLCLTSFIQRPSTLCIDG